MASHVVGPAPHVSWFKRVCHAIGAAIGFIEKEEPKIAAIVAPALEQAFPQFVVPIEAGKELATKIVKQIHITETIGAAVAGAPTSNAALGAAVSGIEPEIDAWIENMFPGSKQVSVASKSGLVQAIYDILKEVDPGAFPASVPPPVAPAPPQG